LGRKAAEESRDEIIQAHITSGDQELLLLTKAGKAIRFSEEQVRQVGRSARGVRGVRLGRGDQVIGAELVRPDMTLLTMTALGFRRSCARAQSRRRVRE
jgi:DNA gyrase subunit A